MSHMPEILTAKGIILRYTCLHSTLCFDSILHCNTRLWFCERNRREFCQSHHFTPVPAMQTSKILALIDNFNVCVLKFRTYQKSLRRDLRNLHGPGNKKSVLQLSTPATEGYCETSQLRLTAILNKPFSDVASFIIGKAQIVNNSCHTRRNYLLWLQASRFLILFANGFCFCLFFLKNEP